MQKIHRNEDDRSCGALTTVVGQSTVYANGKLVSVNRDPNTDGNGQLNAQCHEVYAGGKKVVIVTNHADPDDLCPILDGPHCDPIATVGSPNVFVGE